MYVSWYLLKMAFKITMALLTEEKIESELTLALLKGFNCHSKCSFCSPTLIEHPLVA